jgi:hypothetical protein
MVCVYRVGMKADWRLILEGHKALGNGPRSRLSRKLIVAMYCRSWLRESQFATQPCRNVTFVALDYCMTHLGRCLRIGAARWIAEGDNPEAFVASARYQRSFPCQLITRQAKGVSIETMMEALAPICGVGETISNLEALQKCIAICGVALMGCRDR